MRGNHIHIPANARKLIHTQKELEVAQARIVELDASLARAEANMLRSKVETESLIADRANMLRSKLETDTIIANRAKLTSIQVSVTERGHVVLCTICVKRLRRSSQTRQRRPSPSFPICLAYSCYATLNV